jgi:hypothetical protein
MGIENVTSQKWFTQAMSKTLKTTLDKLATKWWVTAGTIKNLYKTYSKQALVKQILENENIRKTLGRQLIWAWVGAGIGWYSSIEDFQQGNIAKWLGKIVVGWVLWSIWMKLANNPNVLMKVGNLLKKIGWQKTQLWVSILASKIKK